MVDGLRIFLRGVDPFGMLFPARSPWSGNANNGTTPGTAYLSGRVESTRIDASAFELVPLKLEDRGNWDPAEEYWGEQGEPIEKWAKPIIARGPRRQFEMQQVLPGVVPDDPFSDPITESNNRKDEAMPKAQETY